MTAFNNGSFNTGFSGVEGAMSMPTAVCSLPPLAPLPFPVLSVMPVMQPTCSESLASVVSQQQQPSQDDRQRMIKAQMEDVVRNKLQNPNARRLDKYMYKKFGYRTRELRDALINLTLNQFIEQELARLQTGACDNQSESEQSEEHTPMVGDIYSLAKVGDIASLNIATLICQQNVNTPPPFTTASSYSECPTPLSTISNGSCSFPSFSMLPMASTQSSTSSVASFQTVGSVFSPVPYMPSAVLSPVLSPTLTATNSPNGNPSYRESFPQGAVLC